MPLIQVTMVKGRTVEQKHALIKELTEAAMRAVDAPQQNVRVAIYEIDGDNWGIGGTPVSVLRPNGPNG